MSDIESIKEKVRALLAKATDAAATPDEAASAMAMARKLMDKYQLSEDQIAKATDDDFKTDSWHYTKDRKGNVVVHPVDRYCGVMAGKFCGVKPYITAQGDMAAFGFASDVELFKWMMAAFKTHAEADWQRYKVFQMKSKRLLDIKDARKSFMHGFCKGINERLQDWLYREVPKGEVNERNALVVRKLSIVEAKMAEMGMILGKAKHRGSMGGNTEAAGAGVNSARSAGVGRGMGQSYIAIGAR